MTNISKSRTDSSEFKALHNELIKTIADLNRTSAHAFFDELFTASEQIMFIKRFSALIMFSKGYSPYKVWNVLHISPSTAQRLYSKFESGTQPHLLEHCTERTMPKLFIFIEKLIRSQGKDRWLLIN